MQLPRYIGLCGNPKAGKSLVQDILQERYGVKPVDDGAILREIAMTYLGAKKSDVYTQEGKASLAFWPNGDPHLDHRTGKHMNWRQVLGELGSQLEALFGDFVMARTACARLVDQHGSFSFGSVRKNQGGYYKNNGGIILEIINPLAGPSGNDFDVYDQSLVDFAINNDALARGLDHKAALEDLKQKLFAVMDRFETSKAA
jgi:hypothetical protein